tara:strand:- start:201 stop:1169 length:969 start_codon:yes stop_codon:yes gene_type:complete
MFHIIKNYDSVKSKNFTLGNSNFYSENYKTVSIKYNNENFYIQTPYIINRYSPLKYDSKISLNIPLDFSNITHESLDDISILYKLFNRIHNNIKNRLIKDDLKYSSCIKKNKNRPKCPFLKTKLHSVEDKMFLKVFKSDKTLSTQQEIRPGKEIRFILHLESIWVFNKKFGINWYIVQAEVMLPHIFDSYIFDNNISDEIISKHQDYKKFFKMVGMGIPKDAVKIRMELEGFDGQIIYMAPTTLSKIILNKNNEMLIDNISNLNGTTLPKINIMNLKKVKLKKADIIENKKINIERDNRIPTMNQLQDQLNKLKNIMNKKIL